MIVLSAGLNARPQAADMVLRRGLARRAGRGDFESPNRSTPAGRARFRQATGGGRGARRIRRAFR